MSGGDNFLDRRTLLRSRVHRVDSRRMIRPEGVPGLLAERAIDARVHGGYTTFRPEPLVKIGTAQPLAHDVAPQHQCPGQAPMSGASRPASEDLSEPDKPPSAISLGAGVAR